MKRHGLGFITLLFLSISLESHSITTYLFDYTELYPQAKPYQEEYLSVSATHTLYYAQFGNPQGVPVLVVHGGPGAGCSASWSSLFDLTYYRVIMLDQRGAGRSIPSAHMTENTPQLSVQDMETLRIALGIDQWILFGGSWGSALSLLYGQTYPTHVKSFVLRGIFLATSEHYNHLFYGMKKTFPEAWQTMIDQLPPSNSQDLITCLHELVMHPDPIVHMPVAHAFMHYDSICATLLPNAALLAYIQQDKQHTLNIARAFIHYAAHHFFLADNQILNAMDRIAHIPAILVQGRYDVICPAENAYELYQAWPSAELWFIADAGHSTSEPSIAYALRRAMDHLKS